MNIVYGEDLLFRFQFTQANEGEYIYQYLPKYHYYFRENSAVNSYSIYKKVDDLKVFEQILPCVDEITSNLILQKEYLPRLIRYFRLGINSSDYKDIDAAKSIRNKIKSNINKYLVNTKLNIAIKAKLMLCLFPKLVLNVIYGIYKKSGINSSF